jgi:hypothetical protein
VCVEIFLFVIQLPQLTQFTVSDSGANVCIEIFLFVIQLPQLTQFTVSDSGQDTLFFWVHFVSVSRYLKDITSVRTCILV